MSRSIFRTATVLLIAWLLLLGILSIRGFFTNFSLPPRLGFALLVPLPLVLLFTRSQAGKQWLHYIKPQWLIYLQSFRILVEIALWFLVCIVIPRTIKVLLSGRPHKKNCEAG